MADVLYRYAKAIGRGIGLMFVVVGLMRCWAYFAGGQHWMFLVVGGALIWVGAGLLQLRDGARKGAIAFAVLHGLMSVYLLWLLSHREVPAYVYAIPLIYLAVSAGLCFLLIHPSVRSAFVLSGGDALESDDDLMLRGGGD